MSSFELDLTREAFAPFAVPCTLGGNAGEVIVDRDQEVLNEDGRIVDRITLATFLREFAVGTLHGQPLDLLDDAGAVIESFTVGRKESDDGYVVVFEAHKQ